MPRKNSRTLFVRLFSWAELEVDFLQGGGENVGEGGFFGSSEMP